MDQSGIIEELLGLLNRLTTEKGVPEAQQLTDRNISSAGSSSSGSPNAVKPTFSGNEKRRTNEFATLFSKIFFEQQKKNAPDLKPATIVSQAAKTPKVPEFGKQKEKSSWGSIMSLLVGGVALVGAAIPTIIASLFEKIGPLADSLKVLGKMGLTGGLKLLAKGMLKFFALPVLKRLPVIGSLINFWFAYKEFKAGRYVPAIMELVAGIANFVPGVGTALSIGIDILKTFMDANGSFDEGGSFSNGNAWNTIKGWGSSIGDWIWKNALWIPVLGGIKRLGMAKDAFASGNMKEGLYQLGTGILSFGPAPLVAGLELLLGMTSSQKEESKELKADNSWGTRLKKWIKDKLKDLPSWLKAPLEWFGILDSTDDISLGGLGDKAKQGLDGVKKFTTDAWDKIKGPMGDTVNTVSQFAQDTWSKTKDFAKDAWDKTKEQAPIIWESIKSTSADAWEKTKELSGVFSHNIKEMAEKAKSKIDEWLPGIIDTVQGVVSNATKILKGIADRIGSWIGSLFSPEEGKQMQIMGNSKEEFFNNKNLEVAVAILQASNNQTQWLGMLYESAKEQVRLLGALVNVNTMSLQELKRMSGKSGSGDTSLNFSMPNQQSKVPLIPVGDNRNGYSSSPYALV